MLILLDVVGLLMLGAILGVFFYGVWWRRK